MPLVFEKHKDSMGWDVSVHFCKQHENFACVTSNVSVHFESIDDRGDNLLFNIVFKYDTECGLRERKFGQVKFTPEGIFLAGSYQPLYDYGSIMGELKTIEDWRRESR